MSLLDDFMVRATLAAVGVALAAGPIGCFVVWRRMAYFGDATAHAAILGVALALATNLPVVLMVTLVAAVVAIVVAVAADRLLASDAVLGVIAHGTLAVGLVSVALIPDIRIDLNVFLFGDVLAVSRTDLGVVWLGAGGLGAVLAWYWRPMLLATLSEDMARAEGTDPLKVRIILMLMLAVLVAVGLKIVGALLITALLILPAATARLWSTTPLQMAGLAALVGAASGYAGISMSGTLDTPAGPSVVVIALAIFSTAAAARYTFSSVMRNLAPNRR